MAATTLLLQIKYENDNYFELKSQLDEEEAITVIKVNENAHLEDVWNDVKQICTKYFEKELDDIGKVMKG